MNNFPKETKACREDGCDQAAISRGQCWKHYYKSWQNGEYQILRKGGRKKGQIYEWPSERFFRLVEFKNNCWLWTGGKERRGYGRFFYNGKLMSANRFAYEYFVEPLAGGFFALHKKLCGNPSCVKPSHLYAGTRLDNERDRKEWGMPLTGENNHAAKLKPKDIARIRGLNRESGLSFIEISKQYPVGSTQISNICNGHAWAHIYQTVLE